MSATSQQSWEADTPNYDMPEEDLHEERSVRLSNKEWALVRGALLFAGRTICNEMEALGKPEGPHHQAARTAWAEMAVCYRDLREKIGGE